MVQEVPARTKIPTRSPATGPRRCGITVYPAREEQGRWRAVWYENGQRRQCEAASEDKLAARLEKVAERLAAGAPNLERTTAGILDRARTATQ